MMRLLSKSAGNGYRRMVGDQVARVLGYESRQLLAYAAVVLSGTAALLHAWVIREHFADWPVASVFFVVVAFLQGTYAAALLDHPRSKLLLALGLAGNFAIILIWLVAHVASLSNPGLSLHVHGEQEAYLETTAIAGLLLQIGLVVVLGKVFTTGYPTLQQRLRSVFFRQ